MSLDQTPAAPPRLTSLAHGGGCGCKIAPAVLQDILSASGTSQAWAQVRRIVPKELLVGIETGDDAAVYQLNATQALVATTDFFMPVVDDPFDFGRIAATNALSDVYAMGGRPILALALVGMPVNVLPLDTIRAVLQGGESVCASAGIPIAGGHSIDAVEPIYGLVALGLVHPQQVRRNQGARAGDVLVLGKALGVGAYSAALKQGKLSAAHYAKLIATTTRLNTPGTRFAELAGVHAMTDVTGFGLLGHLLGMLRASDVTARLRWRDLPVLDGVPELMQDGFITGASKRNWTSYGAQVSLQAGLAPHAQALLTDPQTSGGLLLSCAAEVVDEVLEIFRAEGFDRACVIGTVHAREASRATAGDVMRCEVLA